LLIIEEKKLCLTFTGYERTNYPTFPKQHSMHQQKMGERKILVLKGFRSICLFKWFFSI
jgi:hypothetical protein